MIAVDKALLENTVLVAEADELKNSGFISSQQYTKVVNQLSGLKTQKNLLIRFGFFLLGSFLFSSIMGTISLLFMTGLVSNYEMMFFVYAIIGFIGCEFFAKQNFYGFGLDDAFILSSQISLYAAIGITSESLLAVFIAMTIVGSICCLRYLNAISVLISCIGLAGFFSNLIIEYKIIEMAFLPFVMLFLAIGFYWIYTKVKKLPESYYYKNSIKTIQIFSLILGYLSVNYLVVRQLSEELMNLVIVGDNDIPFAFLFYGLTFLIPIFFIAFSLYKKDKAMLIIGFLCLGFSFYTIRYYYSVLPLEIALILGGTILFVLTYFSIKKIKKNECGITFKQDKNSTDDNLLNAEALIVNSQLDLKPISNNQNMPFGGGGFSGGGSGSSF